MAVTATISNIAKEGKGGVVVFALFSDGNERSYHFDDKVDKDSVLKVIQGEVDFENSLDKKAEDLKKDLVGTVISSKVKGVVIEEVIQ